MPITAIAVGLTALGSGVSAVGAIQGGNARRAAMRTQQAMQNIQTARERTQQIREARIKRAEVIQSGANKGAGQSSAVAGGAGSITSQSATNLEYLNLQQSAGVRLSGAQQQQINASGLGQLGQGVSSLGATIFNNREEVRDIFS